MSLADLLNQATPGPWRLDYDTCEKWTDMPSAEDSRWVWRIEKVCDFANEEGSEADARLIALAPDMAQLLIDMADALALTRGFVPESEQIGALDLDALLARFADLDTKAGGAQ